MKLRVPESPMQRMALAIGVAVAVMAVGAGIYLAIPSGPPPAKVDGLKITGAAIAYTRSLVARKQPIPKIVALSELVRLGFLKPADVAAFQGMDATLSLVSDASNPQYVLMRVQLPDGSDFELLADGTMRQMGR
ncbi:MAG TPA: hypothetical protein VGO67_05260 [Verrucomicrobiae bacterium]|jgi:hypothetical protein